MHISIYLQIHDAFSGQECAGASGQGNLSYRDRLYKLRYTFISSFLFLLKVGTMQETTSKNVYTEKQLKKKT